VAGECVVHPLNQAVDVAFVALIDPRRKNLKCALIDVGDRDEEGAGEPLLAVVRDVGSTVATE